MKTILFLICGCIAASPSFNLQAAEPPVVRGGSVRGGSATGGSATGGSATGGSATGGSVTGGSVTGGSATGGSATGGSVNSTTVTSGKSTPGTATPGTVTSGTVTSGTVTPGTVTPGTVTAVADGREISVTAPGAVSVNVSDEEALVNVAQQTLIVGKTNMKWDGKDLGNIPAGIKKIKIVEDHGMLSIQGDGKEFARVKIADAKK